MTELLYVLNWALVAGISVSGLTRRAGYLEFPFLVSAMYALWYLPQAGALLYDTTLPDGALARLLFISALCIVMVLLGWRYGRRGMPGKYMHLDFPVSRLIWPTAIITALALAMRLLIWAQPDQVRAAGQWTGPITIIAFFASVGVVSLVLSMAIMLRQRTWATILLLSGNLALYAPQVLIYFRRAEIFELFFAIALSLFFVRGRSISRLTIVAALGIGLLVINGVGHLRNLGGGYKLSEAGRIETRIPTLQEIVQIDWLSAVSMEKSRHRSEARNAVMYLEAVYSGYNFTLGAGLWNKLVQSYVPGQLIGFENKRSLMIGVSAVELALAELGHETHTGTTSTGFVDPFQDFWIYGAFIFYICSYMLSRLFTRSCQGDFRGFVLYGCLITLGLHSITHFGYYLFVNAPLPLLAATWALRAGCVAPPRRRSFLNSQRGKSAIVRPG